MEYVVGFLFNSSLTEVALMHKAYGPYPNKLNGLGGKVMGGEKPSYAMARELAEETNGQVNITMLTKLYPIVTMTFPTGTILHCFGMVLSNKYPKFSQINNEEGVVAWYPFWDYDKQSGDLLCVSNENLAGDGNIPYLIWEGLRLAKC